MVYTLIDHRNDVIKCSKLKWNHEPQAIGFTAKLKEALEKRLHYLVELVIRPRPITSP